MPVHVYTRMCVCVCVRKYVLGKEIKGINLSEVHLSQGLKWQAVTVTSARAAAATYMASTTQQKREDTINSFSADAVKPAHK